MTRPALLLAIALATTASAAPDPPTMSSAAGAVFCLAGGMDGRLAEKTTLGPEAMVEIGGRPLVWHIMNIHAANGDR